MLTPYWQAYQDLRAVYLEASPIIAIRPLSRLLVFDLRVLLTPTHPRYIQAPAGADHDLRLGRLVLVADRVMFRRREGPVDDNQWSLGFIDSWTIDDGGFSALEGAWGLARLSCRKVQLSLG